MAEAMMKNFYGQRAYVQSAGVRNDLEIDGFAIAVSAEMDVVTRPAPLAQLRGDGAMGR
jgi:protein-tyrosine-phosphatase